MVSTVPILAWAAALLAAALSIARGPRPVSAATVADRLLRWLFVFPVGLMGLWGAAGHLVYPARTAAAIGWQSSPFQFEVGAANLGIGVAGLYASIRSFEARLATSLALACFLIGAGVVHIREIVLVGNFAPGNAGPILVTDFLTPTAIFLLLWVTRRCAADLGAVAGRRPDTALPR